MKRTTQKAIKTEIMQGKAKDITLATVEEITNYHLRPIAISAGVYGANGALLEDTEGRRYGITARSMALLAAI